MSSLIDLYLEKLLARMVVDDAQRAEIEKELRSHLEEAVAQAEQKGLPHEQAAREAVLAFGQPSVVARQFGIWWGRGWFYFERIALAILTWQVVRVFVGIHLDAYLGPTFSELAVVALVGLICANSLWNRVEVNGGMIVRRSFRPSVTIPFDRIERVSFQRGHIVGRRNIVIRCDGKQVLFDTGMRGFRAAGVALEALVGDLVDEDVKRFLRRLRLRIRKEGPAGKTLFTLGWIGLLAALGNGGLSLWQGESIPAYLLVVVVGAIPAIAAQAGWHADRSKIGLCWLAMIGFIAVACFLSGGVIVGVPEIIRFGLLLYVALALTAMLAVWWRKGRLALLGIGVTFCLGAVAANRLLPPFWSGAIYQLGGASGFISDARWMPDNEGMIWLTSPIRKEDGQDADTAAQLSEENLCSVALHIKRFGEAEKAFPLPPDAGDWGLFPSPKPDEILLTRCFFDRSDMQSELFRFDPAKGLQRLESVPAKTTMWITAKQGVPVWSPDARYLLLFMPEDKTQPRGAALDMVTGKLTRFENLLSGNIARWTSEKEFQIVNRRTRKNGKGHSALLTENKILIRHCNAATGEVRLEREYDLPLNKEVCMLHGGQYILVFSKKWFDDETPGFTIAVFNTTKGTRVDLPDGLGESFYQAFAWNCEYKKLVYIGAPADGSDRARLILADADMGVCAEAEVASRNDFAAFRFSPDAKHLFYQRFPSREGFARAFGRAEVWNTETGEVVSLRALGLMGLLASLTVMSGKVDSLPLWSPDGRYVAYPAWHPGVARTALYIEIADYGAWLADRKASK